MKVLVACEFSGVVRDAFAALGHDAWSCDLLPCERKGQHYRVDAITAIGWGSWDLLIAHPPCQFLNHAGVRWLYQYWRRWLKDKHGKVIGENPIDPVRWAEMEKGAAFFNLLLNAPIDRICVENSKMHPYAKNLCGEASQIIQPWEYGHGEVKETHLWLKNLPLLKPSNIVSGRTPRVHHASPGPERWKERSRTLPGIAAAMAEQWSF